ncbi:putative holin-like toxin [Paenibacillus sp. cl141a]|nr:putative holin-like toxin [Paenibacillus sp. cl141a]
MEVKDALTIMLLFGSFILALLTYINNNKRSKNPP